jgi:alpha-D-ribose 1-methylphosphonate 5-triphosphate diphosphatase
MWLNDLTLVLPDRVVERGALRIEGGRIAELHDAPVQTDAPSMRGLIAIPGIIDLHGDMLERDIEPRPGARFPADIGLFELDKRLAASGITTAFPAIGFSWSKDDLRSQESATELINVVNALRNMLLVDMFVHARFEIGNRTTAPILAGLLEAGKIHLVSIMDHTPGQGQYKNIDRYISFMHKWLGAGDFTPDQSMIDKMKAAIEAQVAQPRDWSQVEEIAALARRYGVPMASHDDDTAEKVRRQADLGFRISEFPVTEIAAREAKANGLRVVMGAPNAYRRRSTSENLSAWEAVQAGLVDVLATDYFPAAMLHAAFLLADEGALPLHEAVNLVTANAADAVGLTDRGRLAVGLSADIVLVERARPYRVRGTIRHGLPIYWDVHMARLASVSALAGA